MKLTAAQAKKLGQAQLNEAFYRHQTASLENKLKELQEFGQWLTGCGYDFCQHEHFLKNKHLLTN